MRSYCVGLPVIITVHDDGRITYSVDLSEAAQAISEDDYADATDEERAADRKALEADPAAFREVTVDPNA